jgi:hypothetical protein
LVPASILTFHIAAIGHLSRCPIGPSTSIFKQFAPSITRRWAGHILSGENLATIARAPAAERATTFLRLWVRHAARLKACGAALEDRVPGIPIYDLQLNAACGCAAVATAIEQPQIMMLDRNRAFTPVL